MTLVALDADIVMILAGLSSPLDKALERARDVLDYHRDEGHIVALPAAALAECCHCPDSLWDKLEVLTLNAPAALLTSRLFPTMKAVRPPTVTRQQVRFDAAILATAQIHGATILYANDWWFDEAAKKHKLDVRVLGLPPMRPRQGALIDPSGVPIV